MIIHDQNGPSTSNKRHLQADTENADNNNDNTIKHFRKETLKRSNDAENDGHTNQKHSRTTITQTIGQNEDATNSTNNGTLPRGVTRRNTMKTHPRRKPHPPRWKQKRPNEDDPMVTQPNKKPHPDIIAPNPQVKRPVSPSNSYIETPPKKQHNYDHLPDNKHLMITRTKFAFDKLHGQIDLLDFCSNYFSRSM